jgi:hypothetical protein
LAASAADAADTPPIDARIVSAITAARRFSII